MKKDIYIASRFLTQDITGVQRYGIELSKAIKKLNTEYNIKFISPQNIVHHEASTFLQVKKIGIFKGQLWDQISLLKFLKSKGNPLVLGFSNSLPVFYENKIVTIHDIIHLKYPVSYNYKRYYEFIFPLMVKHSKHIITVSEFSKREIAHYYGINENKISVIYNGISEKFSSRKLNTKERYILGVSSIAYHKNFIRLIKAFQLLNYDNIKLYIVGGINDKIFGKDSKKILTDVKNSGKIKFMGRVDDDKLIELYSNAICFVYPSLYEGFGIPPLEAQACGCPVVLSDIPVFREVYNDSVIYFDPLHSEDIARKIQEIINNDVLRELLVRKGFENVRKYTWESSAISLLEVINKVLRND